MEDETADLCSALQVAKEETTLQVVLRQRDVEKYSNLEEEYLSEISTLRLKLADALHTSDREIKERDEFWQKEMVKISKIIQGILAAILAACLAYLSKKLNLRKSFN